MGKFLKLNANTERWEIKQAQAFAPCLLSISQICCVTEVVTDKDKAPQTIVGMLGGSRWEVRESFETVVGLIKQAEFSNDSILEEHLD